MIAFGPLVLACSEGGQKPDVVGAPGGAGPVDGDVSVPFAVDDHFFASGWMGAAIDGAVTSDPNGCLPRAEGAQGRCHHYVSRGGGTVGWVGLYWLSTANNWGELPGLVVESGAQRVTFWAAVDPPTSVRFLVGGVAGDVAHPDEFRIERTIELDATFSRVSLEFDGAEYAAGVQGGFGWVIEGPNEARLWLDDLRWE